MKTRTGLQLVGVITMEVFKNGVLYERRVEKNLVVDCGLEALAVIMADFSTKSLRKVCRIAAGNGFDGTNVEYNAIDIAASPTLITAVSGDKGTYRYLFDGATFIPVIPPGSTFADEVVGKKFSCIGHDVYGATIIDAGMVGPDYRVDIYSDVDLTGMPSTAVDPNSFGHIDSMVINSTVTSLTNEIYRRTITSFTALTVGSFTGFRLASRLRSSEVPQEHFLLPTGTPAYIVNELGLVIANPSLFTGEGLEFGSAVAADQTLFAVKQFADIPFDPEEIFDIRVNWDILMIG